jgi:queuine tRNA-ribosyltransferase
VRAAVDRTLAWAARGLAERERLRDQGRGTMALFGINQGGVDPVERGRCFESLGAMAFDGFALGGLWVGEGRTLGLEMVERDCAQFPEDRPRYLMGVGHPVDLVEAIARGVDLFDCVAPTRLGRTGAAFTRDGRINVKNAAWRTDRRPLDADCACSTCTRFDRAYIRHLFHAEELLGYRLVSLHNVHFLIALMRDARTAIASATYASWSAAWLERYSAGNHTSDQ